MQTYWLVPPKRDGAKSGKTNAQVGLIRDSLTVSYGANVLHDAKKQRLVSFNAEALIRLIKQIVARRETTTVASNAQAPVWEHEHTAPLVEVVEVIELPLENKTALQVDPNSIVLDDKLLRWCTNMSLSWLTCILRIPFITLSMPHTSP